MVLFYDPSSLSTCCSGGTEMFQVRWQQHSSGECWPKCFVGPLAAGSVLVYMCARQQRQWWNGVYVHQQGPCMGVGGTQGSVCTCAPAEAAGYFSVSSFLPQILILTFISLNIVNTGVFFLCCFAVFTNLCLII